MSPNELAKLLADPVLAGLVETARRSLLEYGTPLPPKPPRRKKTAPQRRRQKFLRISRMVDRLIAGRPPDAVLARRAREMLDQDWTREEIAAHFGTTRPVIWKLLTKKPR